MNINTDISQDNKIRNGCDAHSDIGGDAIFNDDKTWISTAIVEIKNPSIVKDIKKRVSCQVQKLFSFEPSKIIRLVELVDQCLKKDPYDQSISFYFTQQVACLFIKKGMDGFHEYLKNSKEKKYLLEVMMQRVKCRGWDFLQVIGDLQGYYKIDIRTPECQKAMIEMAKLSAQRSGGRTSQYIKEFGINTLTLEGKQVLIEIAKLAAQQDGYGTSCGIKNYEIDDSTPEGQEALIEIAKLAAQQNGFGVSNFIKEYGINETTAAGQKALIEIAKLAAHENGRGTSQYIQNFGINASTQIGQQGLIEIAKLAAQQDGYGTSELIKNYGIDKFSGSQQALIAIARLAAQQNGWRTSELINNYGIETSTLEGQQAVIEIAKLAAQQDGYGVSNFIKKYGIDRFAGGQEALIDIAKLAARENGSGTSGLIENYGIDTSTPIGQKALIDIAKLAAQESGRGISLYIKKYGIDKFPQGQPALIEIAKLAAQHDGRETSENIQKYGIDASTPEGKRGLIEIAKLAAVNNAGGTAANMTKYGIDTWDPAEQDEMAKFIFNCFIQQLPTFSIEILQHAYFEPFERNLSLRSFTAYSMGFGIFERALNKLYAGDLTDALQDSLKACQEKFDVQDNNLHWLQEALLNTKEFFIHKRFLEWFLLTAAICSTTPNLRNIFKKHQDTLRKISKLNPLLREALVKEFIHLSYIENIEGFKRMKVEAKNTAHVELACLILANFPREGEAIYHEAIKKIQTNREFKEGANQKVLLELLIKIRKSSMDSLQKGTLIKRLFDLPTENWLQGLQIVSDKLSFNGEEGLIHFSDLADLQRSLSALFSQKFKVKIDHFYEKYEKTIGVWRNKEAMVTYAGKLNELPPNQKKKALKLFQELFTMILKGSFQQDRYNVEQNPHLAEIKHNHLNVFVQWQQGQQLISSDMQMEEKQEEIPVSDRVSMALKRALEQHHLGRDKQRDLYPFVSFCTGHWDKIEESLGRLEIELNPLSGRKLDPEEFDKNKNLLFQKQVLGLLRSPKEIEKKLIELKSHVPKEVEFYNDIESSLKMLETAGRDKSTGYQVIDTDDPNHFMLMGTEVLSSCQNVHGIPSLNVCLLGYFLDGKHRLGLVCDSQGKILARSVLRLLIDSQGQPVLFQERIYVADAAPEYSQLLRKLAIKKAANLGIPLVISHLDFEKEQAKTYPYAVYAKQKPVPFEYVDALNGMQERDYVIQNPLLIYTS